MEGRYKKYEWKEKELIIIFEAVKRFDMYLFKILIKINFHKKLFFFSIIMSVCIRVDRIGNSTK